MPPHGRRRASAFSIFLAFAYLFAHVSAASSILGIDLGTEYIKAALVKPGIPLEIVLTKDSRRKEAAALAFKPVSSTSDSSKEVFPERFYGADAVALAARFSGDVYPNLKPLLGLKAAGSPMVGQFSKRYPGLKVAPCKSGSVCLKSETFASTEDSFTIEELLGMQLQNIRANAEAFAGKGSSIKDVVITVPAFYTAEEKRAVETATELAGLNILAMATDGLAVGINYATSRTFPVVNEGGSPEYHMVYDMGAGSTTATVLKFQGRTVKDIGRFNKTVQEVQVTGSGWDRTLGGDALNYLILEDMIIKLSEVKKIQALGASKEDIGAHGRTIAKMWKEAERMRQVLSANTETQASFEGLYHEDVNFKYKISRAMFEKMAVSFEERVKYPVLQALESAKLELTDLDSIILHGGAIRTPFVQKALESMVGKAEKLRSNVNSDEAAAFGAAFKGASLSPSFRVKEIRTNETAVTPITMSWVLDGKEKNQKLFKQTSLAGAEKSLPIRSLEDLSFTFSQEIPDGASSTRQVQISRVDTKNLTASVKELIDKHGCESGNISTQFIIRLSPVDGLPEITRGSVSCEILDKKSMVDGVKGLFGFGSKKEGQDVLLEDEIETLEPEAESSSTTTSSSADAKATQTKTEEKAKTPEKKKVSINIGLSTEAIGPVRATGVELQRFRTRMKAFDNSDKDRKLREEALNNLEGYTYKVRDLLDDSSFVAVSTSQQIADIEAKREAASDWLYGDGSDAKTADFKARLKELKDLVAPITARKTEAAERPELVDRLRQALDQTKKIVDTLKETTAKASAAAEEASASAAAAAAEASASPSTSTTTVIDELDALDDDPVPSSTPSAPPLPEMPLYTAEDLAGLTSSYETVEKWLDAKIAAQAKLKPSDDPVLLAKDLSAKSEELNRILIEALSKQMAQPKKSKAKTKSKTSSKDKKTKSTTTVTTATTAEPETETTAAAEETKAVKDEL